MFADWSTVEQGGKQGTVELAELAALDINIGEAPTSFVDPGGQRIEAWEITYIARKDSGTDLVGIRERIDAATGRTASIGWPSYRALDDKLVSATRLGTTDVPVLLFGSWLWGQQFHETAEFTIDWTSTIHGTPVEPQRHTSTVHVSIDAHADGCRATISVTGLNPFLPSSEKEHRLIFDGAPVPSTYQAISQTGTLELHMELQAFTKGPGDEVPATPRAPVTWQPLPREALRGGLPTEQNSAYPTPSRQAVDMARQDPAVQDWLSTRPDARISELDHALGASASNVIDEWMITWATASQDALEVIVRRNAEPGLPVVGAGQWTIKAVGTSAPYPSDEPAVPLHVLADLHQDIYGSPPEVLDCFLHKNECWIGTHANRAALYAGETGASALSPPGLLVDIRRGALLQADSLNNPLR